MGKKWLLAVSGCAGLLLSAHGDEVLFKSGDRLTGTVKSVAGGKMLFDSKVAGPLTLDVADIKTFSTDAAIEIALADGATLTRKVSASADGHVATDDQKTLPLADIAKINPEHPKWKGIVSTGATLVRGNTKSDTASVGVEASRRTDTGRLSFGAGYFTARQRDTSTRQSSITADTWFLKGQYDYFISKRFYTYGNLRYEKDRIADLDIRLTPGIGLGYQWIESAGLNVSTEAGANWVYEKYGDTDETRTYMAGRAAYHIDKSFSDNVKAFHTLEYIPSFEHIDDFLVNADVGLRAAMTARLSLEMKSQLAYNSNPSAGRDKKDLRHIFGVGWTF